MPCGATPQHVLEGKMLAGFDGNGIFVPGEKQNSPHNNDSEDADLGQPQYWSSTTPSGAASAMPPCADAVHADDLGGVLVAGGGDAQSVAPVKPRLSPTPSTRRLAMSTVKLSQCTSDKLPRQPAARRWRCNKAIPQSTETLAPM